MSVEPDSALHHRQSIRLKKYDYARSGAYFVTICSRNQECVFGDVSDGEMHLNEYGIVVREEWLRTALLRDGVAMDAFVVMPNHLHGIIVINGRGTARRAPTGERFGKPTVNSVPTIIRSFKSACAKRINDMRKAQGTPVWQRNYYEHVIRDEDDLNRIRQYILDNPARWAEDENNPERMK